MPAVTIGDWMDAGLVALTKAGIENPRLEMRMMISRHLQIDETTIMAFPEREINAPEKLQKMLTRRIDREPLSHILGVREFWSMDFDVGPDVLDPRPDSETLIEAVLSDVSDKMAPLKIIDFGTGSGCLILALMSELPNSTGIAVDISEAALKIAKRNAEKHNLADRCEFVQSSWAEAITQQADIIISNPPYIPTKDIQGLEQEVKNYEPMLALDGGVDGLNPYPIIAKSAYTLLNDGGSIAFEFGIHQHQDVENILINKGFHNIKQHQDLSGIVRVITAKR